VDIAFDEARRMLNTVWRFAPGDMGGVALMEIFPKGRSRRPAGRAIILVLGYPKLRNASMRSAVAGWVDKKPPPLSPDVRVTQVSALIRFARRFAPLQHGSLESPHQQ